MPRCVVDCLARHPPSFPWGPPGCSLPCRPPPRAESPPWTEPAGDAERRDRSARATAAPLASGGCRRPLPPRIVGRRPPDDARGGGGAARRRLAARRAPSPRGRGLLRRGGRSGRVPPQRARARRRSGMGMRGGFPSCGLPHGRPRRQGLRAPLRSGPARRKAPGGGVDGRRPARGSPFPGSPRPRWASETRCDGAGRVGCVALSQAWSTFF